MTITPPRDIERERQAVNARYPKPDTPHSSVMNLWHEKQVAFLEGYRAAQATAEPVLHCMPENSIRAFPEFREYVERLSEPGLAKKQARVIRKEIYDIIDARVANAKIAGSTQKPVGYFSKGVGSSYSEVDPKYQNSAGVIPLYTTPASAPSAEPADNNTLRSILKNAEDECWCGGVGAALSKSASAPSDGAADARDSERLNWLDKQSVAYGFEDMHEGNRWMVDGPFANLRAAIDAAIASTHTTTGGENE